MTRNPWLIAMWTVGALLVIVGLIIYGTAEPANPFLPVEGRTAGEAQAARGVTLIQWGALTVLAAVSVTAARWSPSDRVGEREQPEHYGADH